MDFKNYKFYFKKGLLLTLIVVMAFVSSLASFSAQAAETGASETNSEALKQALNGAAQHTLVMDTYALTLLNQPNFDFSAMRQVEENQEITNRLPAHLETAKGNATEWLDVVKPKMISVNQATVGFNQQFQAFMPTFRDLLKTGDNSNVSLGLNILKGTINQNKEQVDTLINQLSEYRDDLSTDSSNFSNDTAALTSLASGDDSSISILEKQIAAYHEAIERDIGIIAGGAVTSAIGIGMITIGALSILGGGAGAKLMVAGIIVTAGGATAIGLASKDLESQRAGLASATRALSQLKAEVVVINTIKSQVEHLVSIIDEAIKSLEALRTQWMDLDSKFEEMKKQADQINPNWGIFITNQLNALSAMYNEIADFARVLYIGMTGRSVETKPLEGNVNHADEFNPDKFYSLFSVDTGKALDVAGWSKDDNGGSIIQWDYHGGDNQLWKIEVKD